MADDQLFGGRCSAEGKGGLACVVSARGFHARAFDDKVPWKKREGVRQ